MNKYLLFALCTFLFNTVAAVASCKLVNTSFTTIDPIDGSVWEVPAKTSRQALKDKAPRMPTIFIIPPIVGETLLDRKMAKKFCRNGFAAYILNVVKPIPLSKQIPDLDIHDKDNLRSLAAVRAALSTLSEDPALSQNYGLMGMSLGGIFSAFIAGSEPKIKATVIIVGAVNLAGVLATSDQKFIKAQRDGRLKHFNLTDTAAYQSMMSSAIKHDPSTVSSNIAADSVYMFLAKSDTTVPTQYQRQLVSSLKEPRVYEMRGGHVIGIGKASLIHGNKILRFFKEKLY